MRKKPSPSVETVGTPESKTSVEMRCSPFKFELRGRFVVVFLAAIAGVVPAVSQAPSAEKKASAPKSSKGQGKPADTKESNLALPSTVDLYGDPFPPAAIARMGSRRFRHMDVVSAIAYAPDSKTIYSVGWDHFLRSWQAESGAAGFAIEAHDEMITCLTLSRDGKTLVTGSTDKTVALWTVEGATDQSKALKRFRMHGERIFGVALSPDKSVVLAAGDKGLVRRWVIATGKELEPLKGHDGAVLCLAWSPDGRRIASGGVDKTVSLWDSKTGEEILKLRGHDDPVTGLAFSPDSKQIATSSKDWTVRLWDIDSGDELMLFEGHVNPVLCVAFSPDGTKLVSGGEDHQFRVWDVRNGTEILGGNHFDCNVMAVAVSADGRNFATGSGTWNKTVHEWDLQTGEPLVRISGHESEVAAVAYSPDGKTAATVAWDYTLRFWDPVTGKLRRTIEARQEQDVATATPTMDAKLFAAAFSPDGQTIAIAGEDRAIRLYDVATGEPGRVLEGHQRSIFSIDWSPDGKTIASGSLDHSIMIWDTATGEQIDKLEILQGRVQGVKFSPDGKYLATANGIKFVTTIARVDIVNEKEDEDEEDAVVRVWDLKSREPIFAKHNGMYPFYQVVFTPDGKTLLAASADRTIHLYEMPSGRLFDKLRHHSGEVNAIALSPDAKLLASGGYDRAIVFWDMETRKPLASVEDPRQDQIHSLAFSPDGRRLFSGNRDTTGLVWDVAQALREPLKVLKARNTADR